MKIAIPSEGKDLNAPMDERFGRASGFVIYDIEAGTHKHIDNKQNMDSPQGAGIQAAKTVINEGVRILITGNVGPKAHATLTASGIEIFLKSGGTVIDAVKAYRSGTLAKSDKANVEGH